MDDLAGGLACLFLALGGFVFYAVFKALIFILPDDKQKRIDIALGVTTSVLAFTTYIINWDINPLFYLAPIAAGAFIPWVLEEPIYRFKVLMDISPRWIIGIWGAIVGFSTSPAVIALFTPRSQQVLYFSNQPSVLAGLSWLLLCCAVAIGTVCLFAAAIDPVRILIQRREQQALRDISQARQDFISDLNRDLTGE